MDDASRRKAAVSQSRKAHFTIGFQNNKDVGSEYSEKFKEQKDHEMSTPTNNARANNFSVTNPEEKTNYTSEFQEKYPKVQLGKRENPSALKKKHADKNFVFGYDGANYGTNYSNDFEKKQMEDRKKPVNQRQSHIDLGNQINDYSTTYKQVNDRKV